MQRTLWLLCFVTLFSISPAFAARVDVVGAANSSNFKAKDGGNDLSPDGMGFGGGVILSAPLSPMWDIEGGLLYSNKKLSEDSNGVTVKLSVTGFEVPVGIRYWLANFFSLGAGGYVYHVTKADATGTLDSTQAVVVNKSDVVTGSDYGLYVSAKLRLPLSMQTGFVIDGRYNYGLKESTGSDQGKFSEVQALVGFSFSL